MLQTAVNAYLVNTGSKLILIDAGAAQQFGPGIGHVRKEGKGGYAWVPAEFTPLPGK